MISSAMPASEIMITDVKTVTIDATIDMAAKEMANANIGSLIVIDGEELLGILTERDILKKVVAHNLLPSEVGVEDVMAFPLISIRPDLPISMIIEKMAKLNIRRMPIVERGELLGIICSRDLFREAPKLLEISRKHRGTSAIEEDYSDLLISGKCGDCGTYSNNLMTVDGRRLCPNCRDE